MTGKIIKGIAGFYYVYAEDGIVYACRAKGIFRKDKQKPLVGDDVEVTVLDPADREGNVTRILPRRNQLLRPAVANVDQAFVLFALKDPEPNFLLLDRFLVMMEIQKIPAVICFNKKDLVTEEELSGILDIYRESGYPVLAVSAGTGEGLSSVRECLNGKTTVVAGPSGVGKSTITNAMQPEIRMETGEISRKLKRGKHTTRHSQIIPVDAHTFLVDTPGFSSLYLDGTQEGELAGYYPEFARYEPECRFQGCRHIHEPDCGVKNALREGKLSSRRYENYLELYRELEEMRRY